jgi:HD domain
VLLRGDIARADVHIAAAVAALSAEGARIVAVSDAFDAMVAERAYSPKMSPEDAFAELHRQAGTQFDPDVVAAFEIAWHDEQDDRLDPAAAPQPAG